jgi:hypothetical protein
MLVTIKYFSKKTKLQKHERGRCGWKLSPWSFDLPTYVRTNEEQPQWRLRDVIKWKGVLFGRVHRERNKISLDCIHKNIPSSPPWIAEVSARIVSFTSSDVASLPKRITWFCRDSRSLSFSSSWDGASAVVGISFSFPLLARLLQGKLPYKRKKTIQRDKSKRTKWLETRLLFAFDYRSASKWQTIHSLTHANTIINRTHTAHKCVYSYKLPFVLKCTTNTTHPPNPRNRNK